MSITVGNTQPVKAKTCHWCGAHGEWAGRICPLCNNTDGPAGVSRRQRVIQHNRQLRSLLADVLWHLERCDPSDPASLSRRQRLAARVREAIDE